MTSEFKDILFSLSDDGLIATISINRPKKFNAVSFELLAEIEQCINKHIQPFSSSVRVLVIKAEGKHFTAGIDMKSAKDIGDLNSDGDNLLYKKDENAEFDPARKSI